MIGLPTRVTSRIDSFSTPTDAATSAASSLSASRTAVVICTAPPGFIIEYETRLIRSSPKRICGFMRPAEATTSPLTRSHRCAAIVVEPTSTARPYAFSWKPGQTAMIRDASWTATVTCHCPARSTGCSSRSTERSHSRFFSCHSRASASSSRCRSPDGSCMSGSATSTKCSFTSGYSSMSRASASLRTTCRCTWLFEGTSTTTSASTLAWQESRRPSASTLRVP